MLKGVQYIFEGLKAIVPRKLPANITLKFVWQLTPIAVLGSLYYASLEFMDENDPYLMELYDLKLEVIPK